MSAVAVQSSAALTGRLTAIAREARTGRIVQRIRTPNRIVTTGLNLMFDLLKEDTTIGINFFAVGTDATAAAAAQTALLAEVHRGNITQQTRGTAQLNVTYFLPTTAANGSSLVEAGLLTLSSGGTLFARATHTAIVKTASLTVTYLWTLTLTTPP